MRWIISGIALALIVIFGGLIRVWAGFTYFALPICILLAAFWFVLLIKDYRARFKTVDEGAFNFYIAHLVNSSDVTLEMVEKSREFYIKKFKRSQWREKLIEIGKMVFALGVIAACISGIILQAS